MEYIYAAMLIHKAGKKVDESTLTKVLEAAGVSVDSAKVKVVVASLNGVNIDEAIAKASVSAAPAAAAAPAAGKTEKKEEKKEDTKKQEEAASAGLSSLFG